MGSKCDKAYIVKNPDNGKYLVATNDEYGTLRFNTEDEWLALRFDTKSAIPMTLLANQMVISNKNIDCENYDVHKIEIIEVNNDELTREYINRKQLEDLVQSHCTNNKSAKHKRVRVELFENDNLILEQCGNEYYISFYDELGSYRREVTIRLKDDYKVSLSNKK